MKNRTILPFCVVLFLFLFYSMAFSGERPKSFRGLTWGTHISKVPGFVPRDERQSGKIYLRPNEKAYVRPSDSLKVGDGQVDTIEYIFTNDKLTCVILRFEDYGQYLGLKSLFLSLYGAPDKEEKRKGAIDQTITYYWYANKDEEANVTLTWWTWDGRRSGSALMKWKSALKEDAGI